MDVSFLCTASFPSGRLLSVAPGRAGWIGVSTAALGWADDAILCHGVLYYYGHSQDSDEGQYILKGRSLGLEECVVQ